MNEEQVKVAKSLKAALNKIRKTNLSLRVYDGAVYVVPKNVELWPGGMEDGNVFEILEEYGLYVGHPELSADGGAGV